MADENPRTPDQPEDPEHGEQAGGGAAPPPLPPEPTPPQPPMPPGGPQPAPGAGFDDPSLDEPPPQVPPGPPLPPPVPDYASGPGAYDPGVSAPMVPPQQGGANSDGLSVGALVTGILSILGSLCCFPVAVILGIVAVALGVNAKKRLVNAGNPKTGMAQAGFIMGIIGIVLSVIFFIVVLATGDFNYNINSNF